MIERRQQVRWCPRSLTNPRSGAIVGGVLFSMQGATCIRTTCRHDDTAVEEDVDIIVSSVPHFWSLTGCLWSDWLDVKHRRLRRTTSGFSSFYKQLRHTTRSTSSSEARFTIVMYVVTTWVDLLCHFLRLLPAYEHPRLNPNPNPTNVKCFAYILTRLGSTGAIIIEYLKDLQVFLLRGLRNQTI